MSDGLDLSTSDFVRTMAQVSHGRGRLLPVPIWALNAGAAVIGKRRMVQQLTGNLQVSIAKARSLLGWMPPNTVEVGLMLAAGLRPPDHTSGEPWRHRDWLHAK